jgi:hypothetical protein
VAASTPGTDSPNMKGRPSRLANSFAALIVPSGKRLNIAFNSGSIAITALVDSLYNGSDAAALAVSAAALLGVTPFKAAVLPAS